MVYNTAENAGLFFGRTYANRQYITCDIGAKNRENFRLSSMTCGIKRNI